MYQIRVNALIFERIKFISWFDRMREAIAGHQRFTLILFLNILILLYAVIMVYLFVGRGKSNLYWTFVETPYL